MQRFVKCEIRLTSQEQALAAAADAGHLMSRLSLANKIWNRDSYPDAVRQNALAHYRICVEAGLPEAMQKLGIILRDGGHGVKPHPKEALALFKRASDEHKHAESMYLYALMNDNGSVGPENKQEALKYYTMGADLGHNLCLFNLAYVFALLHPLPPSPPSPLFLLSLFHLWMNLYVNVFLIFGNTDLPLSRIMYDEGEGDLAVDKVKARELYRAATDDGNVSAAFNLAIMCERGEGADPNLEEAAALFKFAAERDEPDAVHKFACMCINGHGVEVCCFGSRAREADFFFLERRAAWPYVVAKGDRT